MKPKFLFCLTAVVVIITTACVKDDYVFVTDITLNKSQLTLEVGEQVRLIANVWPENATNKEVIWESYDYSTGKSYSNITVDEDGLVTALESGYAVVTVFNELGNFATCNIYVNQPAVAGFSLDYTSIGIYLGFSYSLRVVVTPSDAAYSFSDLSWENSDPSVVEIEPVYGVCLMTPLTYGTTVITASLAGNFTAPCTVTVVPFPEMTFTTQSSDVNIFLSYESPYHIDWGDGSVTDGANIMHGGGPFAHSYSDQTSHTVKITGTFVRVLHCYGNQLTSLEVNRNHRLRTLWCSDNHLADLELSSNTDLALLYCDNNLLTDLDVSNNTALTELGCGENRLTSLDISRNTALQKIVCYDNLLTNLNVSNNTALTDLDCSNNRITNLDVSKNTALRMLFCYNNNLSSDALNALFATLHSNEIPGGKNIHIMGNPGVAGCDKSIATAKGWTVYVD